MYAVLMSGNWDGEIREVSEPYDSIAIPIRTRSKTLTAYYDRDVEMHTDWKYVPYWARKT